MYRLLLLPLFVALYYVWRLFHHMAFVEPFDIEVTRHEVLSPLLPTGFDEFTICQLSDVHISAHPRNRVRTAEIIRGIKADLFVLTGDMIYSPPGVGEFLIWFDSLGDAILPAIAILGNAEHKPDIRTQDFLNALSQRGVLVLGNTSTQIRAGTDDLQIVGVDDPHTMHEDFEKAYAGIDPDSWTLLLCHSPDGLATIGARRADLMLCGHTHGGQIGLFGNGWRLSHTRRIRGFIAGWYGQVDIIRRTKKAPGVDRLYISRGVGTGNIPLRLNTRPEIALFVLRQVVPGTGKSS
jgi:predicted MPP superfamily phosphohydrolase